MNSQYRAISEIGQRLRAHRIGAGMSPDDVSKKTGISRAAIYRYESGQPIRVDALGKLADLLNVSLTSLFGVGSENIATALSFFERMRQIEESADQISVMFGPISYLLTTTKFDGILGDVLIESLPKNLPDRHKAFADVEAILQILKSRKENYNLRRPNIVSLVSAGELEQFLGSGFIGCANPKGVDLKDRRQAARQSEHRRIEGHPRLIPADARSGRRGARTARPAPRTPRPAARPAASTWAPASIRRPVSRASPNSAAIRSAEKPWASNVSTSAPARISDSSASES